MKNLIQTLILVFGINAFFINISNADWTQYESISNDIFSRDGKEECFKTKNKSDCFVRKSEAIFSELRTREKSYIFTALDDSKKEIVLFVSKTNKKFFKSNGFDSVREVIISPNGKSFAFTAYKNGKIVLVKDGIESSKYDAVENIKFSADSKKLSYIAEYNGKLLSVKDGIESEFKILNDISYKEEIIRTTKTFRFSAGERNSVTDFDSKGILESDKSKYRNFGDVRFSPDGKSFVFTAKKNNENWVVVKDGIESKEYKNISELTFSPNGEILVFIGEKSDGELVVVKNGVESIGYQKEIKDEGFFVLYTPSIDSLRFSPDSKILFYRVHKNNKQILVKDGVEGKEYDFIDFEPTTNHSLQFDSNGSYYFMATKNNKQILVKDGIEIGVDVDYPVFSKNGKSFATIKQVYNPKKHTTESLLIKNGAEIKESKGFNSIYGVTHSPDGKSLAYIVSDIDTSEKKGNKYLIKDGVKGKGYTGIKNVTYSPNGEDLIYFGWKEKEGRWVMVKNGIEIDHYSNGSKSYWISDSLKFSPDSKNLFYEIQRNGEAFLYKNGVQIDKAKIDSLVISDDSKSYSYLKVKGNKSVVVRNGIEMNCESYNCGNILFSPKGDLYYIGYDYENGYSILFKNGIQIGKYRTILTDTIGFKGNSYVLVATNQDGKGSFLVKDGVRSDFFELLINTAHSPDGKSSAYKIYRDGRVYLIKETYSAGVNQQKKKIKK